MSNINKQACDKLKSAAAKAVDNFSPHMFVMTGDVLALLDELESKDSMIAAQQHEIRTLLNALEGRPCPKCNDTGMADSGATQPWGEPIEIECDCLQQDANTAELAAAGIITKVGE